MGARGENSRRRADVDGHQLFAAAVVYHRFGFIDQLTEDRLAHDALRVELFRCRARDDADDIRAPLGALVDDRLDGAEAVADQNKAPIALPFEKINRTVEVRETVFEIFVSRTAEFRQISRPRNPIMAAGVDDEAVMPTFAQLLAEGKQWRQVKIHRHTMNQDQRGVRFFVSRREQRAVEPFVVSGFESVDLGLVVHN